MSNTINQDTMQLLEEAAKQLTEDPITATVQEVQEVQPQQPTQDAVEEEFDPDRAAEQFDVTRAARKQALEQVERVLTNAAAGHNVDKKETIKCIKSLYLVSIMQDMILVNLMGDLVRAIKSMAKTEVDSFNLNAKLFTITQALYKNKLVSPEDLEKIHAEITVPQLVAMLQAEKKEQEEN